MCGRFTLTVSPNTLSNLFNTEWSSPFKPRYNIAPTQQVPVVRSSPEDNSLHIDLLKWGLIPSWAKDPSIGSHMINARSETLEEKPSFRTAFKHRRCIIPASGFYEWQMVDKRKQPYYISMNNNIPMLFAGLWDHWKAPDGTVIESCSIISTSSNEIISSLHDRMPVILPEHDINAWLHSSTTADELKSLLKPCPSDLMQLYPVSNVVNSPKNDSPECIQPI